MMMKPYLVMHTKTSQRLITELIAAYYKTELYDYANDNPDTKIGTTTDKTEVLALYFETIAKHIRNKELEPQV